ncbi:alanine racemase [Candidatus Falkowbacteria bacterium RIFOXYB2_FULL_38_15]|uniref:Alanine racemase n=1 Tax=Candidatus Falkowbacteria bacterium RIFOXYA2_FULL_38_12 TaxID=1797993 RepID=A0A1F5S3R5_9BACT|nr:MAG: alanine racemase [Candidatus Falkowbacteria bacterium RIFOXYA2_FULL_38_12]OGF33747.1 MAG: alanine racemase [Candidatus Falkowbacteria bacterium RIFOXYB2_FULL_38_15]OGF42383.1 MAG: alanine racemase [Candidatus Falkowbacteria bacterium RIFOXYD2_FULL_39_16]
MKTWIEINKKNLNSNLSQFRKLVGEKVKIMGVVKANAYGHGLVLTSKIIEKNVDWFGVDSLTEGLELRKNNIKKPILVLGYVELSDLKTAVKNRLSLTVYNKETIDCLGKIPIKNPYFNPKIHLKLETGTGRQGIQENNLFDFLKSLKKYPSIKIEGASTHYANIEDTTNSNYAKNQLAVFRRMVAAIEADGFEIPFKHTACSAAAILFPETRFDMVRLGISMYGLWSSKETKAIANSGKNKLNLKPAIFWKTKIAQLKKIKSGAAIGYGLTEILSRDSLIAILPIGYFDGYDRKLSSIGNVLIRGQRCKVLGRVCMNMIIVDATDLKNVKIEDEAVLLGRQGKEEITTEEIAQKVGTINYEVISRINPLIPRIIK